MLCKAVLMCICCTRAAGSIAEPCAIILAGRYGEHQQTPCDAAQTVAGIAITICSQVPGELCC
jgi:hypothetical protein